MNKQTAFFVAVIIIACILCVTVGAISKNQTITNEKTNIKTQVLVSWNLGFY